MARLLALFLLAFLAPTLAAFAQEVITGSPMVGSATSEEFDPEVLGQQIADLAWAGLRAVHRSA